MNRADDAAMYHPPETVYSDCGEGQEMADTYKACQPFPALSSTVLFGHFAAAKCPHRTPQKIGVKLGGYPYC